uniref:Putative ovule protein n=1 Tax=Solanum chacoense TaxID=4108 RepID=A0A0V0H133_SOLCH
MNLFVKLSPYIKSSNFWSVYNHSSASLFNIFQLGNMVIRHTFHSKVHFSALLGPSTLPEKQNDSGNYEIRCGKPLNIASIENNQMFHTSKYDGTLKKILKQA